MDDSDNIINSSTIPGAGNKGLTVNIRVPEFVI